MGAKVAEGGDIGCYINRHVTKIHSVIHQILWCKGDGQDCPWRVAMCWCVGMRDSCESDK